jgi:hypothetical protein
MHFYNEEQALKRKNAWSMDHSGVFAISAKSDKLLGTACPYITARRLPTFLLYNVD